VKKSLKEMERKYLVDDFGWRMLIGKPSAVRWVLGEDWDTLDT
jgi:CYTH domain-containing protein